MIYKIIFNPEDVLIVIHNKMLSDMTLEDIFNRKMKKHVEKYFYKWSLFSKTVLFQNEYMN